MSDKDYTDYPSDEVTVKAHLTYKRGGNGTHKLFMRFSDCVAKISDSDTGEKLGEVAACMGGAIELLDEKSGEAWYLGASELWDAFQDMIDKRKELEQRGVRPWVEVGAK